MIKEYRKISTIKAEQFDGSDEMIKKYDVATDEGYLIKIEGCHHILPTLEGGMALYPNDWIATGVNDEYWVIRDNIFRKTYEEVKPNEYKKKCVYCQGKFKQYLNNTENSSFGVVIDTSDENYPAIMIDYENDFTEYDNFAINYCPMCGRKLNEA